jgi:hypothetical protein
MRMLRQRLRMLDSRRARVEHLRLPCGARSPEADGRRLHVQRANSGSLAHRRGLYARRQGGRMKTIDEAVAYAAHGERVRENAPGLYKALDSLCRAIAELEGTPVEYSAAVKIAVSLAHAHAILAKVDA